MSGIRELRVVLTVDDLDEAVSFYRDALGLEQIATFENGGGHAFLLNAGQATLELSDHAQAAAIDALEVGHPVGAKTRLAFGVDDCDATAARLVASGGNLQGAPVDTPWGDRNARVVAPGEMQLTLFASRLALDRTHRIAPATRAGRRRSPRRPCGSFANPRRRARARMAPV